MAASLLASNPLASLGKSQGLLASIPDALKKLQAETICIITQGDRIARGLHDSEHSPAQDRHDRRVALLHSQAPVLKAKIESLRLDLQCTPASEHHDHLGHAHAVICRTVVDQLGALQQAIDQANISMMLMLLSIAIELVEAAESLQTVALQDMEAKAVQFQAPNLPFNSGTPGS